MPLRSKVFGTPAGIRQRYEAPRLSLILTIDAYWSFDLQILEHLFRLQTAARDVLALANGFIAQGNWAPKLDKVTRILMNFVRTGKSTIVL